MSAEDRWADRKEWAGERGELEVNRRRNALDDAGCEAPGCTDKAVVEVEVKRVGRMGGSWFALCAAHERDNDTPYALYEDRAKGDDI